MYLILYLESFSFQEFSLFYIYFFSRIPMIQALYLFVLHMKYLLALLISIALISGVSASNYMNTDGSKVSIERPHLEAYVDMIID